MVPTKLELSCPDSFWQFGLMSLSPNAHRCVVGFRASFMSNCLDTQPAPNPAIDLKAVPKQLRVAQSDLKKSLFRALG